jgi:Protein of Unknown function (DUF2784)
MLLYRILADLIVVLHASYVAFVIVGQAAILYGLMRKRSWARNFYFRWLHLLAIAFVVLQSWLSVTCPLTDLENHLRGLAGESGYPGDFIGYWVHELLFYDFPTWVFVLCYSIFGALVLATFALAPPRWRSKPASIAN